MQLKFNKSCWRQQFKEGKMEHCKYRLPCGWCDRRNEKCELLQESIVSNNQSDPVMNFIATLPAYCDHVWIQNGSSSNANYYVCTKCNTTKTEPC